MTPQEFIAKWEPVELTERSACQQHFLDLCELLGQPKPAAADPEGAWYCFERGVSKTEGGNGWADVWMRGHFGWEYKGKHKDLNRAYAQLLQYRESLENPPLLVVCDLDRFEIHTNFTGTAKRVYSFDLAGLAEPKNLDTLRKLFTEPDALRPGQTSQSVTEQVAEHFGQLADAMRVRGIPAHDAAHFLMKLMFCMFAEDIELLQGKLFSRSLAGCKNDPARLTKVLQSLFQAMAKGGMFGADEIPWFNGGLFADSSTIELTPGEIKTLTAAAIPDWSSVEPHIFGTLFERTLDPAKRSQIGAHYTSSDDIKTLLEPVMMAPLRREWSEVKGKCEALKPKIAAEAKKRKDDKRASTKDTKPQRQFNQLLHDFVQRLAHVTVLDPACGSGNFLYVALRLLLDLEKEVITYGRDYEAFLPQVRPTQLAGIEINPFAQELAQIVIWIGYLQWMRDNGFQAPSHPVLEPIESIQNKDAILDLTDPENPREPDWPPAEFIVGNPPFLGNKRMKSELGHSYCEQLWSLFGDRIPATSDLCCYWFEKSLSEIVAGRAVCAGLLATTGIRQIGGRKVLERITEQGDIFFGISDRDWMLEGAEVRISMVGFAKKEHMLSRTLDSKNVAEINAGLTAGVNFTTARELTANKRLCFMGVTKVGAFDIESDIAHPMLLGSNPNLRPNSDVLRPFRNGSDIVRVNSDRWIIDFGTAMPIEQAAQYEAPFESLNAHVRAERQNNGRDAYREKWWIHGEARPGFRQRVSSISRYIGTARVAKHRIFVWLDAAVLPDSKVIGIALEDDFSFGVLHSSLHEKWTLATCGWHGVGNDATYNPTTCFETFPFPEPTDKRRAAIAEAAAELGRLRTNWLNPPEWTRTETLTFPGSSDGPWARFVHDADKRGIGQVRYPRVVAKDEDCAKELKKRTLTNLYNQRPAWLDLAHKKLDAAVFAAYGWPADLTDDDLLARLLALNLEHAAK